MRWADPRKVIDEMVQHAREQERDLLVRVRCDPKYPEDEVVRISSGLHDRKERFGVGHSLEAAWDDYLEG